MDRQYSELESFDPEEIENSWRKPLRTAAGYEDSEFKAAVIAELITGSTVTYLAEKYALPTATVSNWKARYADPTVAALLEEPKAVALREESTSALADMNLREILGGKLVGYLVAALDTLESQVIFARNPAWLARQSARDVAILHGVIADKTVRLLAGIQPANDQGGNGAPL